MSGAHLFDGQLREPHVRLVDAVADKVLDLAHQQLLGLGLGHLGRHLRVLFGHKRKRNPSLSPEGGRWRALAGAGRC